jgi:alkaline phosphatase D
VASGDPLQHSVILWTRVTPKHDNIVPVECHVATEPNMRRVIARHFEFTSSQRDFTVKVDARGLVPGERVDPPRSGLRLDLREHRQNNVLV